MTESKITHRGKTEKVYFNLNRAMLMKKQNVGIITFPISGTVALSNLVDIFYPLSDEIHLITGGAGYTFFMRPLKKATF